MRKTPCVRKKYEEELTYQSKQEIKEEFKKVEVPGYGFVTINNLGTKIYTKTGIFPSIWINEWGYLIFTVGQSQGIRNSTKTFQLSIHRLVAKAFIPNPNNYDSVNHIDGNKLNNCVTNLEWCTSQKNVSLAWEKGLIKPNKGEKNGRHILTAEKVKEIKELLKQGITAVEIAKKFNVSPSTIDCIKNKRTWKNI